MAAKQTTPHQTMKTQEKKAGQPSFTPGQMPSDTTHAPNKKAC
jgi:hypothetical protein